MLLLLLLLLVFPIRGTEAMVLPLEAWIWELTDWVGVDPVDPSFFALMRVTVETLIVPLLARVRTLTTLPTGPSAIFPNSCMGCKRKHVCLSRLKVCRQEERG